MFSRDLIKMEGGTIRRVGCGGMYKIVPSSQSAQLFFCLPLFDFPWHFGKAVRLGFYKTLEYF